MEENSLKEKEHQKEKKKYFLLILRAQDLEQELCIMMMVC